MAAASFLGDVDNYDATPRALAARTGAVVVSAHYRQAPERRFPAAHEDAYAAWNWLFEHAEITWRGYEARGALSARDPVGTSQSM